MRKIAHGDTWTENELKVYHNFEACQAAEEEFTPLPSLSQQLLLQGEIAKTSQNRTRRYIRSVWIPMYFGDLQLESNCILNTLLER